MGSSRKAPEFISGHLHIFDLVFQRPYYLQYMRLLLFWRLQITTNICIQAWIFWSRMLSS